MHKINAILQKKQNDEVKTPSIQYINRLKQKNWEIKKYQSAKKRLQTKLGFKIHLVIYIMVILLLTAVNYALSSDYRWVKWPMLGWGNGLFFHDLNTYVFEGKLLITEDMIRK